MNSRVQWLGEVEVGVGAMYRQIPGGPKPPLTESLPIYQACVGKQIQHCGELFPNWASDPTQKKKLEDCVQAAKALCKKATESAGFSLPSKDIAALQNAVNAMLKKYGYCPISVDGELGGETCGAALWAMGAGMPATPPGECNYIKNTFQLKACGPAPHFRGGMTQGLGALDACSQGCENAYGASSKKPDVLSLIACFAQCDAKMGTPPVAPPGGVVIPQGTTLPGGTVLPGGLTLPAGWQLPPGWVLPAGWALPDIPGLPGGGLPIPPGFQLPTGPGPGGTWTLPGGWTLPADWKLPGPLTIPVPLAIPAGTPLPGNLPAPPAPLPEPAPSPAPSPAPAPAPGPITPAPATAAAKSETPWGWIIGGVVVLGGIAAAVMMSKSGGAVTGPSENPTSHRYTIRAIRSGRVVGSAAADTMSEAEEVSRQFDTSGIVEAYNQRGTLVGERWRGRWYWRGKRGLQQ